MKIDIKSFLISVTILTLVVVAIFFWGISDKNQEIFTEIKNSQLNLNQNLTNNLTYKLEVIEKDLTFIKDLIIENNFKTTNKLKKILSIKAKNSKEYDQIRFLSKNGQEIVRINNTKNHYFIVPDSLLQFKGDKEYFKEAKLIQDGSFYYSKYDLNMEKGIIEEPYKPVLRVATPVYQNDDFKGVIIVNYLAENFRKSFLSYLKNSSVVQDVFLLNKEGFYLINQDSKKEFAFMFDHKKGKNSTHKTLRFDSPYIHKSFWFTA